MTPRWHARPRSIRIEGYAIVSLDGMIADRNGHMPDALRIDADQRFYAASLDAASAVAHGRYSHEQHPHSQGRRRLILTRKLAAIEPDASNPLAVLWNPAGYPFVQACISMGLTGGVLAVLGGTDVFGEFLAIGYDAFHLSRAARVRLPGGRPVFPRDGAQTPEDVLTRHGLSPGPVQVLDRHAGVTLVTWRSLDCAERTQDEGKGENSPPTC
jgi:dihydrofolate reductase